MGLKLKAGCSPKIGGAGLSGPDRPGKCPVARTSNTTEPAVAVVDNLPGFIPVTQKEIEVIETYLGVLLDAVLASTEGETKDNQ
jgi:hypothetical protein